MQEATKNTSRRRLVLSVFAIIIVLSLSLIPQAFADFSPAAETRVLGVGRIQSAAPAASTASTQERFSASSTTVAEAATTEQLAAPVTREMAPTTSENVNGTPAGEWMTGRASAYGPDNAGRWTATGTELTYDSYGVAVPASMSYLLGHTVEVSYNGITVTCTIVDTGGFGGMGRALDLQPGVWKTFGASSEDEWGVRTVQWRILD